MTDLTRIGAAAKEAAFALANASTAQKNAALMAIAAALEAHAEDILRANREDVEAARANGMSPSMLDRLSLSEKIRAGMEVSELMKRLTGRNYPTFVDNMESVDDLANVRPTGQVIMAKCVSNAPLQVRPLKPIVCVEQQAA